MRPQVRRILRGFAALIISVPVSIVITILLFPFWSWLEATFGIESIGHSGPAEWCYVLTLAAVFCGALVVPALLRKRHLRTPPSAI